MNCTDTRNQELKCSTSWGKTKKISLVKDALYLSHPGHKGEMFNFHILQLTKLHKTPCKGWPKNHSNIEKTPVLQQSRWKAAQIYQEIICLLNSYKLPTLNCTSGIHFHGMHRRERPEQALISGSSGVSCATQDLEKNTSKPTFCSAAANLIFLRGCCYKRPSIHLISFT